MEVLRVNGRGLRKSLAGSFILHIIVISAGIALFNGPERKFISPVYTVDLVGPGPSKEQAPVKAEPLSPQPRVREKEADTKPKEPPKSAKKEEARPVQKESVKVKEDKDAASISEALKKVAENLRKKQESALVSSKVEDIKKKKEADSKFASERLGEIKKELSKAETRTFPQDRPARPAAGGGGGKGLSSGSLQAKYPAYYNIIHDRVQENWIYPEGFELSRVSVIASLRIARSGDLLDVWLEKSSGNARFDESLLNAVKKAAPFPPLPQDMEGRFLESGLRFCPGCTE